MSVVRAHRVPHLASEQVGAQAAVALACREDFVGQVAFESIERRLGRGRRIVQPRPQLGDGRIGRSRGFRRRERLVDQVDDPGQLLQRGLGLEPADRTARPGTDERLARRVGHGLQTLEPLRDAREPVGQRRELAGEEREEAIAEQVHPRQRVPRIVPQLGLREPHRVELLEHEVAIDGFVAA